jgi:hypothetical protein
MPGSARRGGPYASQVPRITAWCVGALLWCAALAARADYIVAANATTSLNGGTLNLSCTSLIVGGTFDVGSGAIVNARNVTVQPGGLIQGGSGSIALSGDWTMGSPGQFVAGTSDVRFDDSCVSGPSLITGSTSFYNVHFTSTTGKSFVFAVNTTQTIANLFEFVGTASAPSQFRSSIAGQVANVNLQPGGTQTIAHVGVTDVWATGQWLAPYQSNEGGGGNARRWFGIPDDMVQPIPAVGNAMLLVLAALLAGGGALTLERGRRRIRRSENQRGGSTLQ